VYLLEVNEYPSMNIQLEKNWMGGGGPKSLSLVDEYVKLMALGDAIGLAKKDGFPEVYKSYTKVFSGEQDALF
jgi:hypothetical protein